MVPLHATFRRDKMYKMMSSSHRLSEQLTHVMDWILKTCSDTSDCSETITNMGAIDHIGCVLVKSQSSKSSTGETTT